MGDGDNNIFFLDNTKILFNYSSLLHKCMVEFSRIYMCDVVIILVLMYKEFILLFVK